MKRHQPAHGQNRDGAERSRLGCIVWAVDFSAVTERRRDERSECEEVEIAMRRAGVVRELPRRLAKRGRKP